MLCNPVNAKAESDLLNFYPEMSGIVLYYQGKLPILGFSWINSCRVSRLVEEPGLNRFAINIEES